MSHDIWASFATAELVHHFISKPSDCLKNPPSSNNLSIFAGGKNNSFPIEDGSVIIETASDKYKISVEFKRQNEGLHGILTALGQSFAYLHKDSAGSIIFIPNSYSSHSKPGEYIADILNKITPNQPIGVFTYEEPDTTKVSPFRGKIKCEKSLEVDSSTVKHTTVIGKTETQWMHVREGSTTPSAFFKYLQTAKVILALPNTPLSVNIPQGLKDAVQRLEGGANPAYYLSSTTKNTKNPLHDKIWQHFWFNYVFTSNVMPIWTNKKPYQVNAASTELQQIDGLNDIIFFGARADSIKQKLVKKLNNGDIGEEAAWKEYAANVRKRAHSFREDIDSGLEGIGMLDSDGRPTDLGYRFIDSCERTNNPNTGTPRAILRAAFIKNGELGAFLHYIYKLSEEKFRSKPLEFTKNNKFQQEIYLNWLEESLSNNLRVMRKVTARGGKSRRAFQGEFAILRAFDFIEKFRIGVGLEINWTELQDSIVYNL